MLLIENVPGADAVGEGGGVLGVSDILLDKYKVWPLSYLLIGLPYLSSYEPYKYINIYLV